MWQSIKNIFNLGVKELRGLCADLCLLILILYSFTLGILETASSSNDAINDAAVAVVDEDHSQLSQRLIDALQPPYFAIPEQIRLDEVDYRMDSGDFTFIIVIPVNFEQDVLAGKKPDVQLNVDATRMEQAFTGAGYIEQIFSTEAANFFCQDSNKMMAEYNPVNLVTRCRFNPNLTEKWFEVIMQLVTDISMLSIILTGAALIRERERGTLEHLLVMPVTSFEIMTSKVWSMGLVVLVASISSLLFVIKGYLGIPTSGSIPLFVCATALVLFALTSLGITLACIADSMPQLGMLLILVLMPMQMLSGGMTPMESMPQGVRIIMQIAPTTHYVNLIKGILFRGAGFDIVWPSFAALFAIGGALFAYSLFRFRKSL